MQLMIEIISLSLALVRVCRVTYTGVEINAPEPFGIVSGA